MKDTPRPPEPGANRITAAAGHYRNNLNVFEKNARDFLSKTLSPSVFIDICTAALEAPENGLFAKTIHQYRYLALMAEARYYEALADAAVMLGLYEDEPLHCQMMCSLYLRRNNHHKALEYIDRLIAHAGQNGLDNAEFLLERDALLAHMRTFVPFSVRELHEAVDNGMGKARAGQAGPPLLVTGKAHLAVNPDTHNPFLVFEPQEAGNRTVYGQCPQSELPFLHRARLNRTVSVLGYFLGADDRKILLKPCHILE